MQKCTYVLVPYVKVRPDCIVIYQRPERTDGRKWPKRTNSSPPRMHEHGGEVSNKAASKIKQGINWLLLVAKDKKFESSYHGKAYHFRLSFITLTLSSKQIHSDVEIKQILLNQFLVEARKKWNVHHYLWRAESQKNDNIHFHILTDRFCPWSEVRDTWNRIQNKLGYVDRYREEMQRFHAGGFNVRKDLLKTWSYKNQVRAYRTGSKNDWNSPNSTDIHSIKHIINLPAYLSKYCTKNQDGRPIEGQLWGLSESLSKLRGPIEIITQEIGKSIRTIREKYPEKMIDHEYYSVLLVSCYMWAKWHRGELYKVFRNYIFENRFNSPP